MHHLCCISMVSDRSSSLSSSSSSKVLKTSSPSHPSRNIAAPRSDSDSNDGFLVGRGDFSRLSLRSGVLPPMELSSKSLPDPQQLPDDGDSLKGNDIVGKFICGILYKWVNIGKGWRQRWLVLQDGVLSYYKIHGPDKFCVNQETEKGSKIIGEESLRQINCPTNVQSLLRRLPSGEIHLKVSTIRQSKSDDKRFSIFSGTKELHLRAATKEDRMAWMEALQAVKDMLSKTSNTELMAPVDDVVLSTERLRQRLLEEGVSEAAIQDCEQIVRSEFSSFQNHLVLFKQKENLLIDTLRQLEVYIMIRKKQLSQSN